jgi:peptidoglycan lytic transglycosylase A
MRALIYVGMASMLVYGCASTPTPKMPPPEQKQVEVEIVPQSPPTAPGVSEQPKPEPPVITLPTQPQSGFSVLPGWAEGDPTAALLAFRRSCKGFAKAKQGAGLLQEACAKAKVAIADKAGAREFFESTFVPIEQTLPDAKTGLLTAYYEPELEVRRTREGDYNEPIFARPEDLVTADPRKLGAPNYRGRKLMGRVQDGMLEPYYTRAQIMARGAKILAWGRPAEVFFLQVQGSGRLHFEDGTVQRAAFAGHNGRAYTSIGRVLIKTGELKPGKASKRAIELWMHKAGPDKARALMNKNARYVFFETRPVTDPALGPVGTQGVPLTAGASLAVDPSLYPFGTPVWVDTRLPRNGKDWKGEKTQFLAIAQDTGGAIKGKVRGDLFLGSGTEAGKRAGIVKHKARWWILVPRRSGQEDQGPAS